MAWKPEFGEGGLRRHCLAQRFDSDEADDCESYSSDPQYGFHAPTMASSDVDNFRETRQNATACPAVSLRFIGWI